jgi:hypothetical protein
MKSQAIINNKTNIQCLDSHNPELRNKELLYMSQYMATILNKQKLAVLKLTG